MDGKNNTPLQAVFCHVCHTSIAPGLLSCPACHSLVYAQELKILARDAQQCVAEGKLLEALSYWRKATELLPSDSQQFALVEKKIQELSQKVDTQPGGDARVHSSKLPSKLLALGTLGLLIWKFKFLFVVLLTKGKVLLLGLTKAQTLFSMLAAFGVYWSVWGWKFALGILLSIYVHEMGHVFALSRFGIPASWPIFIPGVGAFIRLKSSTIGPMEDARIGLAGPIAGLLAALFCWAVYWLTGWSSLAAIAKFGAWINLFNLLPFSPLDGGRGFHAMNRWQKWTATALIAIMWMVTAEGLLILLLIVAVINAIATPAKAHQDVRALVEYGLLVIFLALMCKIHVPVP
jgi:Zn-dependent protease